MNFKEFKFFAWGEGEGVGGWVVNFKNVIYLIIYSYNKIIKRTENLK